MNHETMELGTTGQAAAICGVSPGTYRGYIGRFGAPGPVSRETGTAGQGLYDLAAVRAWHDSRRGKGKRRDPQEPPVPTPVVRLPPVIYQRGAGAGKTTWSRMEWAVAEQGWYGVNDFTTAWHLARGGANVVQVDFTPADGAGWSKNTIVVQRVRARYNMDDPDEPMELVKVKGSRGGILPRPESFDPEVPNNLGQPGAYTLDVDAVIDVIRQALG